VLLFSGMERWLTVQQLRSTEIKCFVKSKTWISQDFGESAVQKLGVSDLNRKMTIPCGRKANHISV
jgi:hypothetical protein